MSNTDMEGAKALLGEFSRGDGFSMLSSPYATGNGMELFQYKNVEDAANIIKKLTAKNRSVYFAVSKFGTPDERTKANALGAWGFWLDIDCGEGKAATGGGYLTREVAIKELKVFLEKTAIPEPTHVVSSGNGIHVYWSLDTFIEKENWIETAVKLKDITKRHGLLADPTRTADIASLLRVPDTYNLKDTTAPKQVKLKYAKGAIAAGSFIDAVQSALADAPSAAPVGVVPKALLGVNNASILGGLSNKETFVCNADNAAKFFSAAQAAYPNPEGYDEFYAFTQECCSLVAIEHWNEPEVKRIWRTVCEQATAADTTNNTDIWTKTLSSTIDKHNAGESIRTYRSTFDLAIKNGWVQDGGAITALGAVQREFAMISLGGKVGVVHTSGLNSTNSEGKAAALNVLNKADGGLLIGRYISKEYPHTDHKKITSQFWIDPKSTLYNGVEFNPKHTTAGFLNLWVGMTLKPKFGQAERIYYFLREVLCGGRVAEYEYLIRYLAHAVQKPGEKPGVMVTMIGGQGVGKGTLGKILQKLWSATFLQVSRIAQVVGDFNGGLERSYIVFLDEALFVGDRASSDALKSLVTEQSVNINEKHQPARQIKSYHRFFAATNADWFKSTDRDDRRDFVLRVSDCHKGDAKFWEALNAEIDGAGVSALLNDLVNMDLSDFNVRLKPNTRELTAQKLQSLEKFPRWWFDCLSQGRIHEAGNGWPEFISSATMIRLFEEAEKMVRSYKKLIDRDVSAFMTKMCPSAQREQGMEGAHRRRGYTLPSVEAARGDFEKYIGDSIDWDIL